MRVYKFTELFKDEKDRKLAADLMYRIVNNRPDKQVENAFRKVAEPMPDAAKVTATTVKGEAAVSEDSLHTLAESTGISEQELKDVTFRKLSAGSAGGASTLIDKLLLCNSVEEIDKLGYETFGNMWPGFKPGGAAETTTYEVKATAGSRNITSDFKMLEFIIYPELAGEDVYIFRKFPYITTLMLIIAAYELGEICAFGNPRTGYCSTLNESVREMWKQHKEFVSAFLENNGVWEDAHKDTIDALIGRVIYVAAYVMYAVGAKCLETYDTDNNDIFRSTVSPISWGSNFTVNKVETLMKIDKICSPYSYLLDWYAHMVIKSKDAFKAFSSIVGLFRVIPEVSRQKYDTVSRFSDNNYLRPLGDVTMTLDDVYKIYMADLGSPVSILHMCYLLAVEESFGGIHSFRYKRTKKGFENPYWWYCQLKGVDDDKFKLIYERITNEFVDGLTSDYGTVLFGHNRELQARGGCSRVGEKLSKEKWSGDSSFEEFMASDGITVDYKTDLFYTPMCVMDHHESYRSVVYDGFDFSESPAFGDSVQYKAQQYTASILKVFNDFVASRITIFGKETPNGHYVIENDLLDSEYRMKDGRSNIESEIKAGKYPALITRSCYISPLLENGLTIKIAFPTDDSDGDTLCLYLNPKTADRDRQIIEACAAEAGVDLQAAKKVELKEITFGTNYAPVMPERSFSLEELRMDLLRHTLFTVLYNCKYQLLGQLSEGAKDLWEYYKRVVHPGRKKELESYLDADSLEIDRFILRNKWDSGYRDDAYSLKRPPLIVKGSLENTSGYALFSQKDSGDDAKVYVRNSGCNVRALERVAGAYMNTKTQKLEINSEWDDNYLPSEGTVIYLIQPGYISMREDYKERTLPYFIPVIVGAAHSVAYLSWDEYKDRMPDEQAKTLYELLSGTDYADLCDLYACVSKEGGF